MSRIRRGGWGEVGVRDRWADDEIIFEGILNSTLLNNMYVQGKTSKWDEEGRNNIQV